MTTSCSSSKSASPRSTSVIRASIPLSNGLFEWAAGVGVIRLTAGEEDGLGRRIGPIVGKELLESSLLDENVGSRDASACVSFITFGSADEIVDASRA